MAKFMNEEGNIVEGTPVSATQIEALDFLREGLTNASYEHLGILYIDIKTREEILKFVAKNFKIERIKSVDEEKSGEFGVSGRVDVDQVGF